MPAGLIVSAAVLQKWNTYCNSRNAYTKAKQEYDLHTLVRTAEIVNIDTSTASAANVAIRFQLISFMLRDILNCSPVSEYYELNLNLRTFFTLPSLSTEDLIATSIASGTFEQFWEFAVKNCDTTHGPFGILCNTLNVVR